MTSFDILKTYALPINTVSHMFGPLEGTHRFTNEMCIECTTDLVWAPPWELCARKQMVQPSAATLCGFPFIGSDQSTCP